MTEIPLIAIVFVLILLSTTVAAYFRLRKSSNRNEAGPSRNIIYAGAVLAIIDRVHPRMDQLIPYLPAGTKKKTTIPSTVSEELAGDDVTTFTKAENMQDAASGDKCRI